MLIFLNDRRAASLDFGNAFMRTAIVAITLVKRHRPSRTPSLELEPSA